MKTALYPAEDQFLMQFSRSFTLSSFGISRRDADGLGTKRIPKKSFCVVGGGLGGENGLGSIGRLAWTAGGGGACSRDECASSST